MDHLADTNVLVRAVQHSHPASRQARDALKVIRRSGDRICVTAQNVIEFWSVCTRPASSNGLGLTPSQTARYASRLEMLFHFLPESPDIYREWKRPVITHSVSGAQVHDARLVAAMNVAGLKSILTFNAEDFARFPALTSFIRKR